jgi:adenylylsulfate kinase
LYGAKTIWIYCPISTLQRRDTKGLYGRASLPDNHPDKITNLTGVNDIYEIPLNPELVINTEQHSIAESVDKMYRFMLRGE